LTISLKHSFQSPVADLGNPDEVGPSEWNAEHSLIQATNTILGRLTAGAGATEELTAAQVKTLLGIGDLSTASIGYSFSGGGVALTTGLAGTGVRIPFACTIISVTLLADQTGSVVIDIWKDTYANYPPTVADTICAAAKPTISSAIKAEDTTLTSWTTAIAAGDVLFFNVNSCSAITNLSLTLKVTKT
jgi:hypothetical protein